MQGQGQETMAELDAGLGADAGDARMVARMRLVLALSALLAVFIDPDGLRGVCGTTWLLFCGYIAHSLVVCVYAELDAPLAQGRLIHWLDLAWYALIVLLTDGLHSAFFLFFFFAILTSSFRWGFEEGARVTLGSAALFAACGIGSATGEDLPRLLLRSTFILALGYMIIYWGRSKVELKRRLALLRAVSHLSNPRFGVDHTVTRILEKTRHFFRGSDTCLLVQRDRETGACSLRTIRADPARRSPQASPIAPEAAALLMCLPSKAAVIYRPAPWPGMALRGGAAACDGHQGRWRKDNDEACAGLAAMLEAESFISVPVPLRRSEGRLYVLSSRRVFRRSDALFLGQVAAQAFPVIENIELLDRMASDAASQERRKIALDLHDTAIQPYVGLKMGLAALRHKAAPDNPLVEDLDRLQDMATHVIGDLRRYAGTVRDGLDRSEQMVLSVLRQQAAQVRDFYGVDIAVRVEGELQLCDRLGAEILQIVREGLSNICRHTLAHRGSVELACTGGLLRIQIENEADGRPHTDFRPRSITERAAALGGSALVGVGTGGGTAVQVEIPI